MVGCAEWAVSCSECRQRIKKRAVKNQRLEQARRLIGSRSEYGGARRLAKTNYAVAVDAWIARQPLRCGDEILNRLWLVLASALRRAIALLALARLEHECVRWQIQG